MSVGRLSRRQGSRARLLVPSAQGWLSSLGHLVAQDGSRGATVSGQGEGGSSLVRPSWTDLFLRETHWLRLWSLPWPVGSADQCLQRFCPHQLRCVLCPKVVHGGCIQYLSFSPYDIIKYYANWCNMGTERKCCFYENYLTCLGKTS